MATSTDHSDDVSDLNAAALHGQLLSEAGNHSQLQIGHSMSVCQARLTALRFLPPETTLAGIESCPAERPGALETLEDWLMVEREEADDEAQ